MTDVELLALLVEQGSAIRVEGQGPYMVAHAELGRGKIMWINQFPTDQSSSHAVLYANTEQVGHVGLAFRRSGRIVAYVAPYDQWPGLDLDAAKTEHQEWLSELAKAGERERFERFTADMRGQFGLL